MECQNSKILTKTNSRELTTVTNEEGVPIDVRPSDDAIVAGQHFVTVEQGQLEKKGLTEDAKQISLVEAHHADHIETADFTSEVIALRLELAATFTDETSIITLQNTPHDRDALQSVHGRGYFASLSRITESGSDRKI